MAKDWTGNKASIFKTIGASNHTDTKDRKMTTMQPTPWQQ